MNFSALKKQKCLVLIGKAGAGKDTVADMIHDAHQSPRPHPFRFSEPLKDAVARIFGWSSYMLGNLAYKEEKLDKPLKTIDGRNLWTRREVLQYVGTDVFRTMDSNVWVTAALRAASARAGAFDTNGYICTDCRFPNELEALVAHFGEVFVVRLVKVGGVQSEATAHSSETEISQLRFDKSYSLDAGDFDGLKAVARQLKTYFDADRITATEVLSHGR
jgi:energy-coupling factor transporter ATP-binding protein EcfA2